MLSAKFWEILWKFWLIVTIGSVFVLLNWKSIFQAILGIIFWFKEGVEDADGEFNSKDLWLMVFSITLICMGFLEWLTQKPFSNQFWAIISVLTTGRLVFKGVEEYFFKKKEEKHENDEKKKDPLE
jgi:hypothetical protein